MLGVGRKLLTFPRSALGARVTFSMKLTHSAQGKVCLSKSKNRHLYVDHFLSVDPPTSTREGVPGLAARPSPAAQVCTRLGRPRKRRGDRGRW